MFVAIPSDVPIQGSQIAPPVIGFQQSLYLNQPFEQHPGRLSQLKGERHRHTQLFQSGLVDHFLAEVLI